jgi:hypothetical protein
MIAYLIQSIKDFFGLSPRIYDLPYQQRAYIITLSTAVERVK